MPDRRTFYDEHPFYWVGEYAPEEMDLVLSPLLRKLLDNIPANGVVLDIGCGPGRVISALVHRGVRPVGLDRSRVSVGMMARRTGRPGVAGDNLRLPFPNGIADVVISDGVIHHASDPRRAFLENCRVTRPGGKLYVAVYKPDHRYVSLYQRPGGFIRKAVRNRAGRIFVHSTFLPAYYLLHRRKYGRKKTWQGVENLFYDYFVTPLVVFLSREEIESWSRDGGMSIIEYDPHPTDKVHCFVLEKNR